MSFLLTATMRGNLAFLTPNFPRVRLKGSLVSLAILFAYWLQVLSTPVASTSPLC